MNDMTKIATFPLITAQEFEQACNGLQTIFEKARQQQHGWLSLEITHQDSSSYLTVTKPLHGVQLASESSSTDAHEELIEDDDEETLKASTPPQVLVQYDITLSPTYQVPVLYFSIKDPNFRFPPTMNTLYKYLIPPHFLKQVQDVGVIGGVTIADHPFTNQPTFFIHPCQTAAVMEASTESRGLKPVEYLMVWIGAIGGCVGLTLPTTLVMRVDKEQTKSQSES